MTPVLRTGQVLNGAKDSYSILMRAHERIWTAMTSDRRHVVVKTAPSSRLKREQETLQQFEGHSYIRQMIDYVHDPPCLVLERLERDALQASDEGKLTRTDIKLVAKNTLEALKSLHEKGIAHTDVKPDNILINFDRDGERVAASKLADCGDAWSVGLETNPKGNGHIIGAAIFRSPEALLQLRWATPTDIWSFGATLISLIWGKGWHIFKPSLISVDDEEFPVHVLMQQARYFGPFPLSLEDIIDPDQNHLLAAILAYIEAENSRKPFWLLQDEEITEDDKQFIRRIMKIDPRDRPSAKQLLEDKWFGS